MSNKKSNQDTFSKQDNIPTKKLPVILGVKPTVYITFLFATVLTVLLSWIIYIQVFKNAGEFFTIQSFPENAAVYIDEQYFGTTPQKLILSPGSYRIRISIPYFNEYKQDYNVQNKIFLRRIRKTKISIDLYPELIDRKNIKTPYTFSENLIEMTISHLSTWNSSTQTSRYSHPDYFQNLYESLDLILDRINQKMQVQSTRQTKPMFTTETTTHIENILFIQHQLLYHSMPYLSKTMDNATHSDQISEWINFYQKLVNSQKFQDFLNIRQNNDSFALQNIQLEKFYQANSITSVPQYLKFPLDSEPSLPSFAPSTLTLPTTFGSLQFSKVQAQTIYLVEKVLNNSTVQDPIQRVIENHINSISEDSSHSLDGALLEFDVPSFYVMNREITQQDFALFLQDNTTTIEAWKNRDKKLISEDHKKVHFFDYNPTITPLRPLRYITWYDAQEYVMWLNEKVKSLGYSAKLPNEFEWRAATLSFPQKGIFNQDARYVPNSQAPTYPILFGTLWEWGNSWYSPAPQYAPYDGPQYGSEKHIFGGSYITKSDDTFIVPIYESRNTSHIPNWATPYVGFRIILVPLE